MNPHDPITGKHRPCADHDTLVLAGGRNSEALDELKKGQRVIKSTVDAVQLDVKDLKLSVWGPNHNNGLAGKVSTLTGSMKIIVALIAVMVISNIGLGVWSITALERHNSEPAHAVMEARYVTIMDSLEKLIISTENLNDGMREHLLSVARQHPEKIE